MDESQITNQPENQSIQTPIQQSAAPPVASSKSSHKTLNLILVVGAVVCLLGAGYLAYGNYKMMNENALTMPSSNIESISSPIADPTKGWAEFTISDLGLAYKLPQEFMKGKTISETSTRGEKGTQRCWYLKSPTAFFIQPVFAEGGPCFSMDEPVWFGSNSVDYEAGREGGFSDYSANPYEIKNDQIIIHMSSGFVLEIPKELAQEAVNANGVKYARIIGDSSEPNDQEGIPAFPIGGTPGKGYIGALVQTKSSTHPILVVEYNLSLGSEEMFDQILSTFVFTDLSDLIVGWKEYKNDDYSFDYPIRLKGGIKLLIPNPDTVVVDYTGPKQPISENVQPELLDGFSVGLTKYSLIPAGLLEQKAQKEWNIASEFCDSYENSIVTPLQVVTINGATGFHYEVSNCYSDYTATYLSNGEYVFYISNSFEGDEDDYGIYKSTTEKITASFKFKKNN